MKRLLAFAIVALSLSLGAATAGPPREVALPVAVPVGITPPTAEDVGHASLVVQVFPGLTTFDENLKVVPCLAASWKVADDLKSYTFTLRKDLTFHDGTPLDANAVVASFELAAKETLNWFWVLEPISGARDFREGKAPKIAGLAAKDALTVEFQLAKPDGIFLHALAMATTGIFRHGEKGPVGAGPWKIASASETETVLVPFAGWHGNKPKVDRLVYRNPGEDLLAAFRAGKIHVTRFPPGTSTAFFPPGSVKSYPSLNTSYAYFTADVAPEVRRLVNRVLDREAHCKDDLKGTAVPSHGVIPVGMRGVRKEPLAFTGEIPKLAGKHVLNARLEDALHARLAKALAPHGIVLERKQPFQLVQYAWIADYPDPDDFFRPLFHSASTQNEARFRDEEVDAWIEKARSMSADLEDEPRMELYRKIEDRIIERAPWLFLWHEQNVIAVSPKVKGLRQCALDAHESLMLIQDTLEVD